MSNELHLINLNQIISEKGGNIEAVDLTIQRSFLQKIGDDIFFMPPSYSKGYKFKYMLLNYLNLKAEIKSRLEAEIITRWASFYQPPAEAPARTPAGLKEMDTSDAPDDPRQETTTVEPRITPPAPSPKALPEEKSAIEKPDLRKEIAKETATQKTVDKKIRAKVTTTQKSVPKKPAVHVPASQKQAVKKNAVSVSRRKINANRTTVVKKPRTLKKELQDLARDMKSLENKIERMIKAFDGSQSQGVSGAKPVKKDSTAQSAQKKAVESTDTDRIVKLIVRRKKNGVDVTTLSEKTGFSPQKIRGIIYRALKKGKIKRLDRGIYVGSK